MYEWYKNHICNLEVGVFMFDKIKSDLLEVMKEKDNKVLSLNLIKEEKTNSELLKYITDKLRVE